MNTMNAAQMGLKGEKLIDFGRTPKWDEYYKRAQNKKFRNKWEKVKKKSKKRIGSLL